ncbi:V-type proton ATPase subunit H [Lingula anatina]|uniref:V-type proton ATPase subunit H n=1 Tax=Lingula anatina TaxID=7574 RepID=A0A1S3JB23_LINAN|nr:V-type proton ATPase subunit H [Lingula anatina]|eukprot:XP_013407528.1 V-type proton ATPase subunit H [Lingula anatina]
MSNLKEKIGDRLDAVISSIDDLEKSGIAVATSLLMQRANDVRLNRVNWQSYLQGQMINQEEYNIITKLDPNTSMNPETRRQLITEHPVQVATTFVSLMSHISKDQTMQYILTMLDDILQEDKSRVEMFRQYAKHHKCSVWEPFLNMLNRPDGFIVNQSSRVIAKIACWSKELMDGRDLQFYLNWLKDQLMKGQLECAGWVHSVSPLSVSGLSQESNEYLQTVCRCLQMMLRIDEYRHAFVNVDGISMIIQVLPGKVGFQIQYQLTFCLWCMTFNPELAEKMNKYNVIPILADILGESVKEKVTRIILATFRNLLEKPQDREIIQDHSLSMVQCKVLKQLQLMEGRKFDDPDLEDDVQFLSEKLQASVQDLSSFDEYQSEVKSGRMEWSPVHKSERFWRENAIRLNEKNYELLKMLIKYLETSKDPLVLSVAAHDIGEYVRHYPRGKHVIEQLGGKQLVMQHLTHDDPNVRYEALLAVQKLMVHNWEYLGKQLEEVAKPSGPGVVPAKA